MNKIKPIPIKLTLLLIILSITTVFANLKTDSLISKLNELPDGEEKLSTYLELYRSFDDVISDTVLLYLERQMELATNLGRTSVVGRSHFFLGFSYKKRGEYGKAVDEYIQAARYFNELNMYKYYAHTLNNLGSISIIAGNFESAARFFEKAIIIHEFFAQKNYLIAGYWNIGYCQMKLSEYQLAESFYKSALNLSKSLNDNSKIYESYKYIGELALEQCHFKEAREAHIKELNFLDDNDNGLKRAVTLHNIGSIYLEEGDYENAKRYYNQAVDIKRRLDNGNSLMITYKQLGLLYLKNNEIAQGIKMLESGIDLANNDIINPDLTEILSILTAEYEAAIGNKMTIDVNSSVLVNKMWKNQHSKLSELKNRLQSTDIQNTLYYRIALDQKEAELAEVEAAKRLNLYVTLVIVGLAIMLVVALIKTFSIYRKVQERSRKANDTIKRALSLIKEEVDTHNLPEII